MNFKTPDDLFLKAKEQILHQDEALMALSVALYYHLRLLRLYLKKDRIDQRAGIIVESGHDDKEKPRFATLNSLPVIPQQTIFITGKTGSGKTHLIKTLCQMTGVNFMAVNATHISNSGYKGMTLADIGEMMVERASTKRHAEFTVLFIDEFDKLFVKDNSGVGDWHRAVATELLTIMEGTTDFPVKDKEGLDSRHILFILGGSFEMHKDPRPPMGFLGEDSKASDVPQVQLDLSKLGLPDELAGRIGRIISMTPLSDEMLKDILLNSATSPFCVLNHQIGLEYCTATLSDELLDELMTNAKEAMDKFGVRGLYQAFNQLPQLGAVLADAPKNRYHHYVLTLESFTKTYHPEYRPVPKIVVHTPPPNPEPPPQKATGNSDFLDDLPF